MKLRSSLKFTFIKTRTKFSYARSIAIIPKGSKIGVASDFPKEIADMHKRLYLFLKDAKVQKKRKNLLSKDKVIEEKNLKTFLCTVL